MQRRLVRGDRAARSGGVRCLRVVDVEHAVDVRDRLEAVRHAREGLQRGRDPLVLDPERACGSRRGGGVLPVVRPRNARLCGKVVARLELDPRRPARDLVEPDRHNGRVLLELVFEDAQLGGAVGLERAVAVEVVRLQVEQDRDARSELVDVLELETRELTDDPGSTGVHGLSAIR